MTAADKCHLDIPFKEWGNLLIPQPGDYDRDGNPSASLIQRARDAASQEFDNYKRIERRINDPNCGGSCSCTMVRFGTGAFGVGGSSIVELAGTSAIATSGVDWITFASEGTAFDLDAGGIARISPPSNGTYLVTAWCNGAEDSGTDVVRGGVYITTSNTSFPGVNAAAQVWCPAGLGVIASSSRLDPMTVSDTWEIGIFLSAPAAATRAFNFGAFGAYGLQVGIVKMCGCDSGAINIDP